MRRRKLSISIENDSRDDGLEVTKAIEIVQSTDQIDSVDALAIKQQEVIDQQKKLDESEAGQATDEFTTDEDDGTDNSENIDGLEESLDDIQALESLIDKFSSLTISAESDTIDPEKAKKIIEQTKGGGKDHGLLDRIADLVTGSLTLEAGNVSNAIWDILKRVWAKLVEFVGKIADTVETFIDIQKSKLNTAPATNAFHSLFVYVSS